MTYARSVIYDAATRQADKALFDGTHCRRYNNKESAC
jgi:hypothetical protein